MVPRPRARSIARKASRRGERVEAAPPSNALNGMRLRRGPTPERVAEALAEIGERGRVVVGVVVAGEQRVRQHRREAGGARVLAGGVEHLVERVGAVDGHERAAPARGRRAERDAEPHRGDLAVERRGCRAGRPAVHTVMLRMSMACALGSARTRMASMTRSTLASGSPMPWKRTPWIARPPAGQVRAERAHLLDDLPRLEVAREAHAAGRAEGARERAADLRADARGEAPRRARAGCAPPRSPRRRGGGRRT